MGPQSLVHGKQQAQLEEEKPLCEAESSCSSSLVVVVALWWAVYLGWSTQQPQSRR